MEKGFTSNDSTSSISSSSSNNRDNNNNSLYLNRNSLKISKPLRKQQTTNPLPPTIPIPEPNPNLLNPNPNLHQPPVYNINKNDFRDVVQKLTGSPLLHHDPPPPLPAQSRPPSSRLQRIRPPPLSQIINRPPQFNSIIPPLPPPRPPNLTDVFSAAQQQPNSFSLLPPLPSVHPAAESPVSAYMRFHQGTDLGQISSPISDYVRSFLNSGSSSSPQLPSLSPAQQQQPNSPYSMPFGCIPSPKSQYGMMFPQTGWPLSPTLPVSSPRWKGI